MEKQYILSERAHFMRPPASPAAILTLGVVTVNEKMYCCTSRCI